jgi:adenylate cyclase 10
LGGDIIKYAGDAFLGIFRAENDHSMQEAIHKAVDTALIIQKNCRNFKTEVGVTLNGNLKISTQVDLFTRSIFAF